MRFPRDTSPALRPTILTGALAIAAALSLSFPSAAQAVELGAEPRTTPRAEQALELTAEELTALSELQIADANRGVAKFSSSDLLEEVRERLEADRAARDQRLAEEAAAAAEAAARAQAEEEARLQAEAEARRVEEERRAAEEAKAQAEAEEAAKSSAVQSRSSNSSTSVPRYQGGGTKEEWMRAAGISESDWGYVDKLIARESSWNPNAVNSSSGACGLVQALPCSKIPGVWSNPVDALKWGDSYVKGRYGSWANALAHSDSKGWY